MARYENPVEQYLDGAGNPLVNGKLFFFKSGTNSQLATFKDEIESIPNAQPVELDAAGRVPNIFFSGSAKVVLVADDLSTGETGKQIFERDPVGGEKELGDFTLWDAQVIYDVNDIVEGSNGKFYISLVNANQADNPVTPSPTKWSEIRFLGIYNVNISYAIGDVTQTTDGNLWKSLKAVNLNNDPSTDSGTNWIPAIDGDKIPQIIALTTWINQAANFTIVVGESYQVDGSSGTVDAAMPAALAVGDVITVHNESISTNKVQLTNPSFSIKGIAGTAAAGTDLELEPGDTVKLVAKTTLILEVV